MAKTTSLATLIETLCEETSLGYVLPSPTQVAASLTLADGYGAGPFSTQRFGRGAPIFMTSPAYGGRATASTTTTLTDANANWVLDEWIGLVVRMGGKKATITDSTTTGLVFAALDSAMELGPYTVEMPSTYIDTYTPSTGVITVDPDFTAAFHAAQVRARTAVVLDQSVGHMDVIREAINRALEHRCWRKELRPLTYVPDGDIQGDDAADHWPPSGSATSAYVSAQAFPAEGVDAVGALGLSRVIQLTSSAAASLASLPIRTRLTDQLQTWYFRTAIRLVSGTGTASFEARDNTNSAAIDLQVTRGNDANTLTTSTVGDFMVCEGTFQVPATCVSIKPLLRVSATTMVAQMGPVIMYPLDAASFPLSNRVRNVEEVGNFFYGHDGYTLGATVFSDPITIGGAEASFSDYGDHLTVTFNFRPTQSVWYEEIVYGKPLYGMTETTTFDADDVIKWAKAELYARLYADDPKRRQKAIEAQRAARRQTSKPLLVQVGRR